MTEKEAYGLLELRPGASDDAVKKAYRRLAQKVHPDKGGSAALFRQVQEAYELLTSKKKGTSQGSSGSANAEHADGAEERRKREEERRRKTEEQRRRSEEERRKRREEESRRAKEAKKKKDKEAKKKAAFEDYYERQRKAFSNWEIFKWSLVWGHFDRVDQKFEAERRELARRFGEAPRGRADETENWQTFSKKEKYLLKAGTYLFLMGALSVALFGIEALLIQKEVFNLNIKKGEELDISLVIGFVLMFIGSLFVGITVKEEPAPVIIRVISAIIVGGFAGGGFACFNIIYYIRDY